jgi:hypothetical protein
MEYKGLIFTNHILERMKQRNLRPIDIYWIFSKPDKKVNSEKNGAIKFYRNYRGVGYIVVGKKNENKEWIMLSCCWKESNKNKLGFWKNFWQMLMGR